MYEKSLQTTGLFVVVQIKLEANFDQTSEELFVGVSESAPQQVIDILKIFGQNLRRRNAQNR